MPEGNTNTKTQRNVLIIIILLLLCGFGYYQVKISNLKKNLNIAEQNTYALSDSIRIQKNKNKDIEFSRGVLVTKGKDLESLSKNLSDELDKEKGKVHRLQRIVGTMGNQNADGTVDTLKITNTVHHYVNGDYGLKWGDTTHHDSVNFRELAGISDFKLVKTDSNTYKVIPLTTKITNDRIGFNIVTGLRTNDEGMVEIFVRSDYPNFKVTQLEGAIIDPNKDPILKKFTRQKKFSVGPYLGIGVDKNLQPTLQLGVGVGYKIISF